MHPLLSETHHSAERLGRNHKHFGAIYVAHLTSLSRGSICTCRYIQNPQNSRYFKKPRAACKQAAHTEPLFELGARVVKVLDGGDR